VSEPGHPGRHYRVTTRKADHTYVDPGVWLAESPVHEGSWWPEWTAWLARHSGELVKPPAMAAPLCAAPGTYVLQA